MQTAIRFFRTKTGILTLVALGALLLLLSFRFPYWNVKLRAPQYPDGLHLSVYMDRVEGDVQEVNLLNHYIGMGKLDEAADFERQFAWYGLFALSLGAFFLIPAGKKLRKLSYLPPFLFLGGFIGDFFYWLYRFGHDLSPDAPVRIKPFTPTFVGPGKIGQFTTMAMFGSGFWIAVAGSLILFYAIRQKQKLCAGCGEGIVCDHFREDLKKVTR
jgi:copper chaperone NosL